MSNTKTGCFVITVRNPDEPYIGELAYTRINVVENKDMLCPVKRLSRAKIFNSYENAAEWKSKKYTHSDTLINCELIIRELRI